MKQYLELCQRILNEGEKREDRTGTGTLSVFGHQMRFDLQQGFPMVTTKKLHLRSIIHELLWFLSGDTNIKYLQDNKVKIWDAFADEDGNLGPVYGKQWRDWVWEYTNYYGDQYKSYDQIASVIKSIKENPQSRRHIVNAWNVGEIEKMALPPCHLLFQFYVREGKYLDCQLYQRSADVFLGVPFNIASYALLTMMIAQVTDLKQGHFIHTIGDAHLYLNHVDQVMLQLTREPLPLPTMKLNPDVTDIDDFKYEDFSLEGYESHPHIKGDVSV